MWREAVVRTRYGDASRSTDLTFIKAPTSSFLQPSQFSPFILSVYVSWNDAIFSEPGMGAILRGGGASTFALSSVQRGMQGRMSYPLRIRGLSHLCGWML